MGIRRMESFLEKKESQVWPGFCHTELYLWYLLSAVLVKLQGFSALLLSQGPFKYYVSMLLAFLDPPTFVSKNSTVNQQKLPFSDPIYLPLC